MRTTAFTRLVGCELPIQVAPMGGITTPELGGAVVKAGGHAMFGLTGVPAQALPEMISACEKSCGRTFGVNFLAPFLTPDVIEVAASTAPLVEIFHGDPEPEIIRRIQEGGALASWQVTSREEALRAADAGCDMIVAHGIEAGGRMPGGIGLLPLLEQVLGRISVPVLAAGGIATARGFAAVLAAGADGLRMGTRFLTSAESGGHPAYIRAVVDAEAEDTTYTTRFNVLWPDGAQPPHRVLASTIAAAEKLQSEFVGEMQTASGPVQLPRFAPVPPSSTVSGHIEAMPMYAGQSAGAIHEVLPAGEIVARLTSGADELLEGAPA